MTDEKLLILHVDDEIGSLTLINIMLQRYGYGSTLRTGRPHDGLALAYERRPHLILLDTMLPEIDGFELCRRLRADERTRSAVIIFMSVSMYEERLQLAFECGADAGYSLPLHPSMVRDIMAEWTPIALERRRAEQINIGGNPITPSNTHP